MSEVLRQRGKIAALSRSRSTTDPELVAARRDMAAAKLEDYIRRIVDQAPPLNDSQRSRLAALLAPTRDAGGSA